MGTGSVMRLIGQKGPAQPPLKCRLVGQFALPDHYNFPPQPFQFLCIPAITIYISSQLLSPELRSSLREYSILATSVTMPETAVDEHHRAESRENNVRLSRQIRSSKGEPESIAVQEGPDATFRSRVLAADAAHVPTAPIRSQTIHAAPPAWSKVASLLTGRFPLLGSARTDPRIHFREFELPKSPNPMSRHGLFLDPAINRIPSDPQMRHYCLDRRPRLYRRAARA